MSTDNIMNSMEDDLKKSNKLKAALLGAYAACVLTVESITRPIPIRVLPTSKDEDIVKTTYINCRNQIRMSQGTYRRLEHMIRE
ncbi:hypothetical protein AMTR_s00103p00103200 [Amborella trichopoda]|uniref:Uncharacterized protein n=1 Tax=Amborella trichopoda TaxID=13333 RepID=W1NZQ8_AMBTC|nr:hypothetical protein AMTR_s00103p00103200 [Amborella trichopoda]